jgi:hypothetical protein
MTHSKGDVIRLKPPLHRLYRKRIGSDRLLFSVRGEDVYLELMGIAAKYTSWPRGLSEIEAEQR